MNKRNKSILFAIEKGYDYIDGFMCYKGRPLKLFLKGKYYFFGFKTYDKTVCNIPIHRFIGYKKFGDRIFDKSLHVRHLDSNSLNNSYDNIGIGTFSENMMDKSPELRRDTAIKASLAAKKHDHEKIIDLHKKGYSYDKIMNELGTKSKGTISFIIRKSMEAKSDVL